MTAAAVPISLSVWIAHNSADRLIALLGRNGARAMARLAAFLLLCVGVQILSNGIQDLMISVFRLPQPPG
jgi:multiple antibiotic resistance protein